MAVYNFSTAAWAANEVQVRVMERGESAAQARNAALAKAEQKAFRKLVMERAPNKADAILGSYESQHISQLVQGYEVIDEVITDNSYRATLKIIFNDGLIAKLLNPDANSAYDKDAGQDFANSNAVLVLPVYRDESGIFLWGEGNIWREYVNRAAVSLGFDKVVMPYGDPTDRLMIDAGNVTTASYALLSGIARRYGAGKVVIAVAEPEFGAEPITINAILRVLSPDNMEVRNLLRVGDNLEKALKNIAEAVISDIGRELRTDDELPLEERRLYKIAAHISDRVGVQQLVTIRNKLHNIEGVEDVAVTVADWQNIILEIFYRGNPEMFGRQLAVSGVKVREGDGYLMLSLR